MKRLKKILLLAVAMLLAAVISITATIAYLKSQTDVAQNAFAVGKVRISLDEAKVNEDGQPVDENGNEVALADAPRVLQNSYKLAIGKTYVKAPVVHVSADSEPCWIIIKLEMHNYLKDVFNTNNGTAEDQKENKTIFDQMKNNGWLPWSIHASPNQSYYAYLWEGEAKNGTDIKLFETITVRSNADTKDTTAWDYVTENGCEIKITAFAVQADGMYDEFDAWDALAKIYPEYVTE